MSRLVEEWRPIRHYEGVYEASNWGRVRSLDRIITHKNGKKIRYRGRILIPRMRKDGYLMVQLSLNGNVNGFLVHRLVAETFLENNNSLPCVNHKDENKHNNNVDNLEWCSYEYNNNYGTKGERLSKSNKNNPKYSKTVYQYDFEGKLINIWESVNECHRNGFDSSNVCNCCNGKYKQYKGYKWSYEPL